VNRKLAFFVTVVLSVFLAMGASAKSYTIGFAQTSGNEGAWRNAETASVNDAAKAMWVIARGIASLFAQGHTILFEDARYEYIANGFLFAIPFPIIILAVVIGAIVMQTLTTTILTNGVPVQVTRVIKALVVVFIILIQSEFFRTKLRNLFRRDHSRRKAHEAASRYRSTTRSSRPS
jgi:hypothetical protein